MSKLDIIKFIGRAAKKLTTKNEIKEITREKITVKTKAPSSEYSLTPVYTEDTHSRKVCDMLDDLYKYTNVQEMPEKLGDVFRGDFRPFNHHLRKVCDMLDNLHKCMYKDTNVQEIPEKLGDVFRGDFRSFNHHLRWHDGITPGTLLPRGGMTIRYRTGGYLGFSICSCLDNFDKKRGARIADGRIQRVIDDIKLGKKHLECKISDANSPTNPLFRSDAKALIRLDKFVYKFVDPINKNKDRITDILIAAECAVFDFYSDIMLSLIDCDHFDDDTYNYIAEEPSSIYEYLY